MELLELYHTLIDTIDIDYINITFVIIYLLLIFNLLRLNFGKNSIKYTLLILLVVLLIANIVIFYLHKNVPEGEPEKKKYYNQVSLFPFTVLLTIFFAMVLTQCLM